MNKKTSNVKTNTDFLRNKTPVVTSCETMTSRILAAEKSTESMSSSSASSFSKVTSDSSEVYVPSSSTTCSEHIEYETSTLQEDRKRSTLLLIEKKSRFYLGVLKGVYILIKLIESWENISYVDILITLKKIRTNDVYVRLADDFGVKFI